jgi:hypothetical protein
MGHPRDLSYILGGGDAAYQVFLLLLAFGADRESVEDT